MHLAVVVSRVSTGLLDAYRCGLPWSDARKVGIKRRRDGAYVCCNAQVRVNGETVDCDVGHLDALCLDVGLCEQFGDQGIVALRVGTGVRLYVIAGKRGPLAEDDA
ncbi:hypothetical protein CYMTET_17612 [Cymbomonas tetramitiformis]|uniref:Uncharacterized protein n=1 Tax=Cymbomonas tetramitiformis TaxID=36881 RepID=A0AAE0G9S6_9CHLO|nr:hypothetical protein CYMTET_17612 [Cymbomonas tetramitiformis]